MDTDTQTLILEALSKLNATDETSAVKPLDIRKHSFPNSIKKVINSSLYKLLNKGLVKRITNDNGTKPRWYLVSDNTSVSTSTFIGNVDILSNVSSGEEKLLNVLKDLNAYTISSSISTKDLKKNAYPDTKERGNKIVNSPLYKLMTKGLVKRITNERGTKPKWYLVSKNSSIDIETEIETEIENVSSIPVFQQPPFNQSGLPGMSLPASINTGSMYILPGMKK